eukprot:COSAG05_NODE_1131_length_5775_cov_33.399930_3_plen_67_part_00
MDRLKRRIETLVRTIEKELEGPLTRDKEKRRASASAPHGDDGGNKRKAAPDSAGSKVEDSTQLVAC